MSNLKITQNIPKVKLGIVAVSRDCFPSTLSEKRREAVVKCLKEKNAEIFIFNSKIIVENEADAMKALADIKANGVNALVIFLGNFGPESPETMLAQKFDGPVMFAAAAEETKDDLFNGRGDAYCGMLSMSYNMALRNIRAYIPEYPVGTACEVSEMIMDFEIIARAYLGIKNLKIMTFGPRPQDFFACNSPIAPLYNLGVEVQENSELDLYESYIKHENDKRIPEVVKEIEEDLKDSKCNFPKVIENLARYELTLRDWYENNLGASSFAAFANKCWPAFQTMFHFVPCYVNSRFASKGIPIACETDIYGALTEYILTCVTEEPVTLLDINNTVPKDLYDANQKIVKDYTYNDLFMGFHCGNTPVCRLKNSSLAHQLIMKRLLEPDGDPYMSRGTLEGDIAASDITFFRLQSSKDGELRSYIAEGETLDIPSGSFGGIGVVAIKEMARFYRHVLIQKQFPHHGGVGFKKCGRYLFELLKLLGIEDINYNQPKCVLYKTENPFA
ncbi:MAG: fucose isomerase [Oscillospiraceae bacterium]|nr:fucose isomerase [Oscillospiraceae bacterium]